MSSLSKRFQALLSNINQAPKLHDLQHTQLLAVSKKQSVEAMSTLYHLGQRHFGESYLQEAIKKIEKLSHFIDIIWHFIGPLQSNKIQKIAKYFQWVHSVDRLKVAIKLNEYRAPEQPPLNICIQVNSNDELTKAGVSVNQLQPLLKAVKQLPRLRLRGLMTIPAPMYNKDKQMYTFMQLYQQLQLMNKNLHLEMDTLSMGMSHDFEAAIASGATFVRIGSALFGKRAPASDDSRLIK